MNITKKISAKERGLSKKNRIVITGGDATGHSGNTNLIKIEKYIVLDKYHELVENGTLIPRKHNIQNNYTLKAPESNLKDSTA